MGERPRVLSFADARNAAIDATVALTSKLSAVLAVADVLASHGFASAGRDVRSALMNAIHALHVYRHQLLALETSARERDLQN